MKVRRMLAASALAAGLAVGMASPALAHNPPGSANDPKLVKRTVGAAQVNFSQLRNAPGSPEPNALRFETTGGGTKAQVRAKNVGILGNALGDVNRLSLKARHAGAPRLVMQLSNGHWMIFETGGNCGGGVDFGNGWFKYNFSTADNCAVRSGGTQYDNYAEAVGSEGAGKTIQKVRVTQNNVDGTGWVDDIRLGGVLFAGPNINTHNH